MHKCSNCGTSAKTKKKLKEHELLCKLEMNSVVVEKIEPTNRQMWVLIQKLAKQNEILTKKVEELERVVHKDIKKINITEWLNKNIHVTLTYSEWLNGLNITQDHLQQIFNENWEKFIEDFLKIECSNKSIPLKCFHHKKNCIYIYEKKWKKASEKDLVKIFNKFQNKILKESIKWEQGLSNEQKFGSGSMSFLRKNDKILVSNTKLKEKYQKTIKLHIIKNIKEELDSNFKYQLTI